MGILNRIMQPWATKQGASPAAPSANGKHMVKADTGVSFVGSPDWRQVILLSEHQDFQAEELTRSLALATSAYAYTAVMYRATRISEPPLFVYEDGDEGLVYQDGHELNLLLDEPSPDYDMGELQLLTEVYRLVTGACLWVVQQDMANRPARYLPFSGDEFTTEAANGRIYGRFLVSTAGGKRSYGPEQVVHLRDINPNSWRKNLSRLDVALQQLDLGHQVNRMVHNFMRKAMFPGGVISPDADWNPDDDAWAEWKNDIAAWHRGPANAGEPLVVQGGTQFSKAALGMKELLPSEMLDRIEALVGSVFGVPPVVLGWEVGLKNSPWSQMEQARQMTYEDTIEPRWKDIEKRLTRQLLPREEREANLVIRFDTTDVRAFNADDQLRSQVAMNMRREWTLNERRVYTGKDPLPKDDPRGDEIDTGSGAGGLLDLTELGEGEAGRASVGLSVIMRGGAKGLVDAKTLEWALFDSSTKAAELTWTRTVANALEQLQGKVLNLADDLLTEKQEVNPDSMVAFIAAVGDMLKGEGTTLLQGLVLPLVISTGKTGVRRAAAQTGISFATLQPGLLEYAAEESAFLASVMGRTTGQRVAATVQSVLSTGGLVRDIRKALQDSAAFSRTRAQLVARTETTRAWNGAQRRSLSVWERDVAPEAVHVTKEWLSSRDDRVRDEHDDLDGTVLPIDGMFNNGLTEPGEPNCRCTLVYSIGSTQED
jgi:HK97 family phage portal protein